jgi:hypothetical protein
METAKAISPSTPFAASAAKPLPVMDDMPPWDETEVMPAAAAPIRRAPVRTAAKARPLPQVEAVHWSVIAPTLFTAFNVLLGAFGGDEARPRELLPIIMVVTAP